MHALGAVFVAAAAALLAACSHHSAGVADAAVPAAGDSRIRANLSEDPITFGEIQKLADRDAYTAIQLLRPVFLKHRGTTSFFLDSPTTPEVFVDGMYYGPLSSLRSLPAKEIAEVRFMNVGDATIRYGTGHTAGIIDIATVH